MMANETMRETLTEAQKEKLDRLRENIRSLGSLAVGFSGGVDSSLLVFVAHEVLGDRAIAVPGTASATFCAPSIP